jgi:hypothetical protein
MRQSCGTRSAFTQGGRGDDEGRYRNTSEAAAYLDPSQPGYAGDWIELASSRLYSGWSRLSEALRTGRPQSDIDVTGDSAGHYHVLYAEPERRDEFLRAMRGSSLHAAQEIATRFSWRDYYSVADIGCAEGTFLIEIAQKHPHLHALGFDLQQVASVFQQRVEAHDLVDRLQFQPGDFHKDALPSAQVLVLGRVLHNWDLNTKRVLLAKAFAALPENGALIIYERMIDDARRDNLFALVADSATSS